MPESPLPDEYRPDSIIPESVELQPESTVSGSPPVRPPGPGFWAAIGLWVLFLFAQLATGILIAASMLMLRAASQNSDLDVSSLAMLGMAAGANLLIAGALVLIFFRSRVKQYLAMWPMSPLHTLLVVAITLPLVILSSEVNNWVAEYIPQMEWNTELFSGLAKEPLLPVILIVCVLPALGEEFMFRGLIGRGLVARYGIVWGTLITSVLFGLMHIDLVQASSAAFLGIALQLIYLAPRSIWAPILLHFLNNLTALLSQRLPKSAQVPGLTAVSEEVIPHTHWALLLASMLAVLAIGWMMYATRVRWIKPDSTPWSPGYITAEHPAEFVEAQRVREGPQLVTITAAVITFLLFIATLVWVNQTY